MSGSDAVSAETDLCASNTHRKYWAERKCSVITGNVFDVREFVIPYLWRDNILLTVLYYFRLAILSYHPETIMTLA